MSRSKPWNPLAVILAVSAAFFIIFLAVSGVVYLQHGSKHKASGTGGSGGAATMFSTGSIGVIEMAGVINDSRKTVRELEEFDEDADVKGVVLRLNSPGGAVAPSQEIYEAVRAFKKPLVASMGSVAASGGFYIACGAKKVYANAGTITGSIGVIMEFMNLSKLYEWAKVKRFSIKTGKYKDAGAEYRDMNDDERALLQGMVDDVLLQFKNAVSIGRGIPLEEVTKIADGRIFSGAQAKKLKLVDELGTFNDAVADVAKQANLKGKPTLVYPERHRKKLLDLVLENGMGGGGDEGSETEVPGLLSRLARAFLGGRADSIVDAGTAALSLPSPGVYWLWKGAR